MSSPDATLARKEKLAETAAQLEEDIDALRSSLGVVARELDRRRHRISDIPARLKRNARPLLGTAALALGVGTWLWQRSRKRSGGLLSLLPASLEPSTVVKTVQKRLAEAFAPEAPTHPVRSSLWKISTAGMTGAAAVLGKTVASHLTEVDWSSVLHTPTPGEEKKIDPGRDASFGR
ncbi:MAG TPA: hypothetical protein VGP07_07110 [Polyangia bacterium]|jgi:hypothetical protein